MLAIGRALMARPRLLLMDEPSAGVAPLIVHTIFRALDRLNAQGLTMLIVEQHTSLVLEFAQRGYVLGDKVIVSCSPKIMVSPAPTFAMT